ncbi:MAG: hypothetical protein Q4B85_11435 [Lachnospiraceae bacterium]|nr:hypothetical protein [Lachnospiraceae bacterium]
MNYKRIHTNGIECLEKLQGTDEWYWGSDYCSGDLYEAEELFQRHHTVSGNRLVFVKYPEGKVVEPVPGREGQYFGTPVYDDGAIMILLADFHQNKICVMRYEDDAQALECLLEMDRSEISDCYNLLVRTSPLYLSRDGNEGEYEILWPQRSTFQTEENETVFQREGDYLISTRWYEVPEYHEETMIRRYPSGELLERIPGQMMELPDRQKWIVG